MRLLDTDMLSLLFAAHARVVEHYRRETDEVATSLLTRIEILEGRFASVKKAGNGEELLRPCDRLQQAENNLATLRIVPMNGTAAVQFDKLRQDKKLKKIGQADLLIASIALAQNATLVTRNKKHFQKVPGLKLENWAD